MKDDQGSLLKSKPILILGAIILLILVRSASFILGQKSVPNRKVVEQISPTPTVLPTLIPSPANFGSVVNAETVIYQIYEELNKDPELGPLLIPQQKINLWWISNDDWNINVEGGKNVKLQYSQLLSGPISKPANYAISMKFHALVAKIMNKINLSKNVKNSSISEEDDKFYDYIQAFDNEDVLCSAVTNAGRYETDKNKSYFTLTLTCVDSQKFKTAYDEQIPFLKGLNRKEGIVIVSNIKIKNNVATMNLSARRGGAKAFMYKSGSEWKKISVGQSPPECNELENVPEEYWIACYEENGNFRSEGSAWK